ncbi:MAG: helix-turn-helix transcriptional regulator [Saprospiraceae bacterium]|nr:helix-turn-helix transcriptional regulator [Saprospiraceae bacterium]
MFRRPLFFLFLIAGLAGPLRAQLTAESLEKAVLQERCDELAAQLEGTPLRSESMKFFGGICFYRRGEVERALVLFEEAAQMEARRQHFATYWAAKCQAALQRDSLALASLLSIPRQALSPRMLASEEFERLARTNASFQELQRAVAPGFNGWTGILAAIALLGFLIAVLLLFGRSRFSAGEKRLALVVFAFAAILASYLTIWTGYESSFPYLRNLWPFLTYLVGPSLYLYLKDTFQEEYTFRKAALHYLLPAFCGLLTLPAFLADLGWPTGLPRDLYLVASSPTLLTGHLLLYATLVYAMTRNEWQVDANIKIWTNIVAWGLIAYTAAFISYFVLVRCSFFNPEWDYAISLVMALGILTIAYMGLLQRKVFRSEPIGRFLPVAKYRTSGLTPGASESIKRRLERLLTEEQVFKENELRLDDLAAYLDIGRHQLSQVINQHYGVNFFELINRYRVEHVKRLLADPAYSQYTIIQIAYEAGFNNKASFNRYFKKEIGITPSAYRIREEG